MLPGCGLQGKRPHRDKLAKGWPINSVKRWSVLIDQRSLFEGSQGISNVSFAFTSPMPDQSPRLHSERVSRFEISDLGFEIPSLRKSVSSAVHRMLCSGATMIGMAGTADFAD